MKSLEKQCVEHKAPLVQQIDELRIQANTRQTTIEQKLAELQDFRHQMKSSSEDARKKDEQIKALVCDFRNLVRANMTGCFTVGKTSFIGMRM